jgi:exopolysaccharide biosynthesis predicted pyruvyltransferase EpsI
MSTTLYAYEELRRPFVELAKALLNAADGREVIFLQNHGNYGDCLIRYGTLRFFEDIGLRYREYDMAKRTHKAAAFAVGMLNRPTDRYLFIYSGSGAWSEACRVGLRNVRRQLAANRNIFILPTTFQYFGLPRNIPVFARDRFESLKVVPHARFCHDMALYLALVAPERFLTGRAAPNKALGLAFRTDNEAGQHNLASLSSNLDISVLGTHSSDPIGLLRLIDQFSEIATDRVHIALGAILLGKRVFMTEGNHFKMRAIFDSSIKGIFNNCDLLPNGEMHALVTARKCS